MIRRPRSLLARILLWHTLAVIVTAVAVSAGVYLFLDATATHLERQTLRAQVASVRAAMVVDGTGAVGIGASHVKAPAIAAGMNVLVLNDRGVLASVVDTPPPLPVAAIPRWRREAPFDRRSRRSVYTGLSVPVVVDGRRLWIVAIQNLDHPANVIDDLVRQFLWYGLAIVLPLLLLLLAIDAVIVRHALRPVRRASASIRTLDASRPGIRVSVPALPSEVRPLADAVNSALDRLTESLRTSRDFTADAAHELRTPITLARVRAAEVRDPALRAALIADLDRLGGTVGHLLDIAELDSIDRLVVEPVDIVRLAEETVSVIAPLAFRAGKTIELLRPDAGNLCEGHPHFLSRAVAALLENAVRHTPAGTHIVVDVRSEGAISVADDGPGIAAGEQALVFRRFWRRDRAAPAGSGLGLSIVRRIAEMHGGGVTLRSRPGRTVFTLRIGPDA